MHDYVIRQATIDDIPKVMKFIHDYWKSDHILCNSQKFMKWQHLYHGEFCFAIAEDNDSKELEGIVGYIPYSEEKPRDVFGALWKVKSNRYPGLGLKLKLFLMKNINARSLYGIGLNDSTLQLHRISGAAVEEMRHYYILSERLEYKIPIIHEKVYHEFNPILEQYDLQEIQSKEEIIPVLDIEREKKKFPRKSYDYICHRYIEHPVYQYHLLKIMNNCKTVGIYVTRVQKYNNAKVLRIIDYFGDIEAVAHTGNALKNILDMDYEYIDFYEYGIDDDVLTDAGFVLNPHGSTNVIPNYFEPFVRENIRLTFYAHSKEKFYIFKGDGDQDRPNKLKESEQI